MELRGKGWREKEEEIVRPVWKTMLNKIMK